MTYKDFLEDAMLIFGMCWEERRKYIKEYMLFTNNIIYINPLKGN